jgi:hypothetical protein
MLNNLRNKVKSELPEYKRFIKNKAIRIKDEYVEAWQDDPYGALMTSLACGTLALAIYYRHVALQRSKGFWVEFTRDQLDAMDKEDALLIFKIVGDDLFSNLFYEKGA